MARDGWANFFLGLGVGVGIGLLIAPKSGEETREFLLNKADEGKDLLKKHAADLGEKASGLTADLVERGKDVLNRQKDVLSDAIEAGRLAYRDKVQSNEQSAAPGEPA